MSYTLPLKSQSPHFNLKSTNGKYYTLSDFKSDILVIFFTCNHCPYVIGSDEVTRKTVDLFKPQGVDFVAINSNSPNTYPEDSYDYMIERMNKYDFPWVYLYDKTQNVARNYGALKTPHFYVFNQSRELIYCGRGIDSPRDTSKMTKNDLENALNELLTGKSISVPLTNPIGCNIKWEGKDAHWMPEEACDLI